MQQAQDQLSTMPAFMAAKLMGTTFRGAIPALLIATTAAAGGLIYGAVKAGQGINKHVQKTKAGDNKASKLFRDLDALDLKYPAKHELAGQPIPTSELVRYYKIPEKYYKDFERAAKKNCLPYSCVEYPSKDGIVTNYEIMISKKHEGVFDKIVSGMAQKQEKAWKQDLEDRNTLAAQAGRPVFVDEMPDFKSEIKSEMKMPKDLVPSLHNKQGKAQELPS